ncbi:MAG: DUF4920 domain-containing protein [Bacteroidota bacterium]
MNKGIKLLPAIAFFTSMLALSACGPNEKQIAQQKADSLARAQAEYAAKYEYFGDSLTTLTEAVPVDEIQAQLPAKDSLLTTVKANITGSCQNKGCWATVKLADNQEMTVRFKDYGFFLPVKDLKGRELVMQGKAFRDTTSVADLKEQAADAGLPKAEIEAIKEPRVEIAFEASGVALQK